MSWTSSPWKWYVLLSVIIQIHNYTFILKTFWKHLTDISDYKGRSLSSIKARSQIKDKSLISCMCQYSTLLEQLSLLSLVFLYLQYIFYFVNFALIMRDLLELETRSKHFLPTSSATSCNKKDCFIIHKLTLNSNWNYFIKKRPKLSKYVFSSYYFWVFTLCSSCVHVFYLCFWQR